MPNVGEIFGELKAKVEANPAKVATLVARFQFDVTGDGGGVFHAVFDKGALDIGEGAIESPGCTVVIGSADFVQLIAGKLNPTAAFMSGKLKIKGDMGMAMKLQSILA